MYLISKPKMAMAVQVVIEKEEIAPNVTKVSARLGPLAEWVCIQNHDKPGSPPPAGFGLSASVGGVPHIHTPTGLTALQEGLWVVVYDDQAYVLTQSDLERDWILVPQQQFHPSMGMRQDWAAYRMEPITAQGGCPTCHGKGTVIISERKDAPYPRSGTKVKCDDCLGTGSLTFDSRPQLVSGEKK